jgi:hypothetical protein
MVKTGVTIFFPMFWECWLLFLYLETVVCLKLWGNWIAFIFSNMGVSKEITDVSFLPVALLLSFSSAGSRGFLMN